MNAAEDRQEVLFRQALKEGPGRNDCSRILGADHEETSAETYFSGLEWANYPSLFYRIRSP